jgi:hypothetical protein
VDLTTFSSSSNNNNVTGSVSGRSGSLGQY